MAHAKLAPSASARWINCPGSVNLIGAVKPEEKSSKFAVEGTVAHAVAEFALTYGMDKVYSDLLDTNAHGQFQIPGSEKIEINHDMIENVEYYYDYVEEIKGELYLEFKAPLFYSLTEDGTIDALNFRKYGKHCDVVDLKYGKGVAVSAEDNTQLLIYFISALDHFSVLYSLETVTLHIVMPRQSNRVSTWELTMEEVERWRKRIEWAAAQVTDPRAPRIPGEKQCRWCPVKSHCAEFAKGNISAMKPMFQDLTVQSDGELSLDEAVNIYNYADQIRDWLDSIYQRLMAEAMGGTKLKGYYLKYGKSMRKWANDEEAKKVLLKHFNEDQVIKKSVITAAQSDKLTKGKTVPDDVKEEIKNQITKTTPKLVLARGEGENVALCQQFPNIKENQ